MREVRQDRAGAGSHALRTLPREASRRRARPHRPAPGRGQAPGTIRNAPANMSASAAGASTPSAGQPASAPSAAARLRRAPSARSANPAPSGTASATANRHANGRRPRVYRMAGAIPRPSAGPTASGAAGAARPAGRPASASVAATPRPRKAGRCASRAARTGGKRSATAMPNAGPPASAFNAQPQHPAGRLIASPCAAVREERRQRNPEAWLEAGRRRYAERKRQGRLSQMRQAGQRSGRVPGLPRGRARPLRRPPGRRGLRQVQDAHHRRSGLLRALPRRQGGAPRPRGGIRRQTRPVCRTPGQGPLRPVRRAVARRGPLRALFAQAPRELGGVSRHPRSGTPPGR